MFARTERLLLRPGWIEDAPALFKGIADEAIVRNLASAPWPYTLGHAEAFLATERRPNEPSMLIFLRTAGAPQLVGTIGLACRYGNEVDLGYWIARPFWGHGFATEAGQAVVRLARESLRLPRLTAGHLVDNPASGRVLEKLGFRPTGVTAPRYSAGRGGAAPCRLFEIGLGDEPRGRRTPQPTEPLPGWPAGSCRHPSGGRGLKTCSHQAGPGGMPARAGMTRFSPHERNPTDAALRFCCSAPRPKALGLPAGKARALALCTCSPPPG